MTRAGSSGRGRAIREDRKVRIRSVEFDAGLQEQLGAQLLNLAREPEDGIDDRVGILHRVNGDLTLDWAHAHSIDFVIND